MKGMIYIFTGDGKGKTSAALGVAVRAVSAGMKVAIVQWYKEKRWPISEHQLPKLLKNIRIYPMGQGFYQLPTDHATPQKHHQAAQSALKKAQSLLGKVDLLVLDEVNNAISDKLLTRTQVIKLLKTRGETHLILTGRSAHQDIIQLADLVTNMGKIKHPFDKGKKAIKGLDF